MKLIIDTDCGLDDAKAIMMAIATDNVEILAITCVNGNTHVDNVIVNVLRTLDSCGKGNIPIYKGAHLPLMGNYTFDKPVDFHGYDGFGDVNGLHVPDISRAKTEHAANRLTQLAKAHPGEITLVTLGPLTNIAMAIRMDRDFPKNLKQTFIMGGNTEGRGNVTVTAEANFGYDPEAAFVVLNELLCPITIAPWEMCLRHYIPWEDRNELLSVSSKQAELIRTIEHRVQSDSHAFPGYIMCDEFAMAAALDPSIITRKLGPLYVSVELHGHYSRGQMILDTNSILNKRKNTTIIEDVHMINMKLLVKKALSH